MLDVYDICMLCTVCSTDFQSGFREHLPRVSQLASENNPACEITPENVVEILSINVFCLKFRFLASFCIDLLC